MGRFNVGRIAIDGDVLAARVNSYVKERFEVFDVLIMNTKERFQAARRKFDLFQILSRSLSAGDKLRDDLLTKRSVRERAGITGI